MEGYRRIKPARKKQQVFFRSIFLTALLALTAFFFLQSSFWSLKLITVEGNRFVDEAEILQLAAIPLELNIFKVDLDQAGKNIVLHPLIKSVKLDREIPQTIKITVEERTPVAVIPSNNGFLEVDENKVVLRITPTIPDGRLPLITGVKANDTHPGQVIPSEQLGDALELVKKLSLALQGTISEISLFHPEILYLYTAGGLEIHFGGLERVEEKIQLLEQIFQQDNIKLDSIQYIDLSFNGLPVIKYRN